MESKNQADETRQLESPTPNTDNVDPDYVDVSVENHGSVFLFRLHTSAAREWVNDNVASDAMFFGDALAVEHRFAASVAAGMIQGGLEVR
jgi:hypothetical protein